MVCGLGWYEVDAVQARGGVVAPINILNTSALCRLGGCERWSTVECSVIRTPCSSEHTAESCPKMVNVADSSLHGTHPAGICGGPRLCGECHLWAHRHHVLWVFFSHSQRDLETSKGSMFYLCPLKPLFSF